MRMQLQEQFLHAFNEDVELSKSLFTGKKYDPNRKEIIKENAFLTETRLTERAWGYTLKAGVALRDAIKSGDARETLVQLYNAYHELFDNGLIDDWDLSHAIDNLEEVELADDIEEAVDYELNELYDLCDNLNVWVAINDLTEDYGYEDDEDDYVIPTVTDARYDSIKDWYVSAYPDDDLGKEINPDIDFQTFLVDLQTKGADVYDMLGVSDSVIRERVFEKCVEFLPNDVTYDRIYTVWVNSETYDKDLEDYRNGLMTGEEFSEKHRYYTGN